MYGLTYPTFIFFVYGLFLRSGVNTGVSQNFSFVIVKSHVCVLFISAAITKFRIL